MAGLLPPGVSAEHLGPFDYFYWDDFWGVAGLRAGAELLAAAGQPDAAADAERFAAAMWADVEASLELTARRLGTPAIPAGPGRRLDSGAIGSLVACAPLDLLPADDPRMAATADLIRDRFTLAGGRAFYQGISHTGLGTYLTMQLAAVELRAGDRRCLDRLAWLLDAATPDLDLARGDPPAPRRRVHGRRPPRLGGGRAAVVRARPAGAGGGRRPGAVARWCRRAGTGAGWEVHDAPTAVGRVSYAVRWHGDRVALLWEVDARPGVGPVRLTAPGLDACWSTTEARGEALLGPVPAPPEVRSGGRAEPVAVPAAPPEGGSFA